MLRYFILIFLFSSQLSCLAIVLPEDTMVKIAYVSHTSNQVGHVLDIYVREPIYKKENGHKKLLIPQFSY